MIFCGYLIWNLPADTFTLFAGWLVLALAIYFGYSRKHSQLARSEAAVAPLEPAPVN
ncbi:amino acid permease C-terminal domain-containing protein [Streptomyces sioyaensis]|uniref:amino acid permease C-terminal domain-containing protein n=1 Tax=Streptomyces sioyaensis TaxID=67364 RepID=UPI003792DCBA